MPDAPGLELVAQDLADAHPGAVRDTQYFRDQATLVVEPEHVLDALRWLRDTDSQAYRFLASLHGVDYLPHAPRFGVHYQLLNLPRVERINVKVLLDDPAAELDPALMDPTDQSLLPRLDSCVGIFPTANFQEREVYDLFGVVFDGHPDLRRILMPEAYVGYPQRRDFPVGGEPVLFTYNEHELPRWYAHEHDYSPQTQPPNGGGSER